MYTSQKILLFRSLKAPKSFQCFQCKANSTVQKMPLFTVYKYGYWYFPKASYAGSAVETVSDKIEILKMKTGVLAVADLGILLLMNLSLIHFTFQFKFF